MKHNGIITRIVSSILLEICAAFNSRDLQLLYIWQLRLYTQRNLFKIIVNQTKIRLCLPCTDWFRTANGHSLFAVQNQSWCMVNTTWFRVVLTWFRKYFQLLGQQFHEGREMGNHGMIRETWLGIRAITDGGLWWGITDGGRGISDGGFLFRKNFLDNFTT